MFIVAVLTIIAFAWLYNPADTRELGANVAARIYGRPLSRADLERQARLYDLGLALGEANLVATLGGGSQDGERSLSEFVFNVLVMRHEAQALGIEPTTEQIANRIRLAPAFQESGHFDPRKFEAFVTGRLGPLGMTTLQVEEVTRDALRLERLTELVGGAATVSPQEKARAQRIFQKSDLVVFRFATDVVEAPVSQEQSRAFFDRNVQLFVTPESLTIEVAKFTLPDAAKASDGKERIAALQDLAGKASVFSESAKTESLPEAAASAGATVTRVGPFDRQAAVSAGAGVPPAVAQGAFLLASDRAVSDVLQAGDDFYVFRVTDRAAERPKTFEEARPEIEARIRQTEVARLVQSQAARSLAEIRAGLASGKSMTEAAAAAGVPAETFSGVDPSQPELPPDLMICGRVAPLLEPGQISNALPTAAGPVAVGVVSRALPSEAADVVAQIAEGKSSLFFASWLASRREASGLTFPQARTQ